MRSLSGNQLFCYALLINFSDSWNCTCLLPLEYDFLFFFWDIILSWFGVEIHGYMAAIIEVICHSVKENLHYVGHTYLCLDWSCTFISKPPTPLWESKGKCWSNVSEEKRLVNTKYKSEFYSLKNKIKSYLTIWGFWISIFICRHTSNF